MKIVEQVLLREAKQEDIPVLVAVIHCAFQEYQGRPDPPSGAHEVTIETIRQKMNKGGGIVAMINQEIVGCVLYEPAPDHIYLGRLAVLPPYRRRGIARKLIERAEHQAHALGYTRVRLGVRLALADNRTFFEQLGFRVLHYGSHAGHVEPTFVNLEKDVRSDAYSA